MAIFNTVILPYFSCGLPTTIPEASNFFSSIESLFQLMEVMTLYCLLNSFLKEFLENGVVP